MPSERTVSPYGRGRGGGVGRSAVGGGRRARDAVHALLRAWGPGSRRRVERLCGLACVDRRCPLLNHRIQVTS